MKSDYVLAAHAAIMLIAAQAASPAHAQEDFISTCKQAVTADLLRSAIEADVDVACQCAATETRSARVKPDIMSRVFFQDEVTKRYETNVGLLYDIYLTGADNGHQGFIHFTVTKDDANRSERLFNRLKACFGRISATGLLARRTASDEIRPALKAAGFSTALVQGQPQAPSFLFGHLIGNRILTRDGFIEYASRYRTRLKGTGWPKPPGAVWTEDLAAQMAESFVLVCDYSKGLLNDGVTWDEDDSTAYLITPKSTSVYCPVKP